MRREYRLVVQKIIAVGLKIAAISKILEILLIHSYPLCNLLNAAPEDIALGIILRKDNQLLMCP